MGIEAALSGGVEAGRSRGPRDAVITAYRDHGFFLARGGTTEVGGGRG